jgi:hypothetical protein
VNGYIGNRTICVFLWVQFCNDPFASIDFELVSLHYVRSSEWSVVFCGVVGDVNDVLKDYISSDFARARVPFCFYFVSF